MEFVFNLDIIYSQVAQVVFLAGLLCMFYLVFVYRGKIARLLKYYRLTANSNDASKNSQMPAVSVIIYCKDSPRALESMLPHVLTQEVDAPFEVIVSTDGRNEHAEDVVMRLSALHKNLRMTYVPDEAHALSRKKLAVTLGVKAARYDYVVLTDANAQIQSTRWLKLLCRHFAEGKEVVIGSSFPLVDSPLSGMGYFNMLVDKVTYLSSAISHRAYRGEECNLAFYKQLFFDNNGFTDSVELHHGIDDIFLSRIVSHDNYVVELSGEAQVGIDVSGLDGNYTIDRIRHEFTGRRLRQSARRLMGVGSVLMWLWLGLLIAAAKLFWPNPLPLFLMMAFGIVWLSVASVSWCRAARVLHVPLRGWHVPFYMFNRPLTTLGMKLKSRKNRSANYTWAKPM